MAVNDNVTRIQIVATAAQTVFIYPFEIFDKDDIVVEKNGTVLTEGVTNDYTVLGVGNDNGGSITLLLGATAGDIFTLFRDMALERLTDFQQNGDFLADEVNNNFDRQILMIQQNKSDLSRSIRPTVDDPALNSSNTELANVATRGGKALGFNPDGTIAYITGAIALGVNNDTTLSGMVNDANATVGQSVYRVSDRADGIFDTVTTGVTPNVDLPNTRNIVVSVFNPLISFVLRIQGELNAKQFGIKGDYSYVTGTGTDDSDGIIVLLNVAMQTAVVNSVDQLGLYFPSGKYRATKTVLSAFDATFQVGLNFRGDGKFASMFIVDPPTTSDVWLFDNGAAGKIQHMTFTDIGFAGETGTVLPAGAAYTDINQFAKLFKITAATGTLHEKGFGFTNCNFLTASQFFEFDGDDIASEIKFVNCRMNRCRDQMYTIINPVSFNHDFISCDVEVIFGDIFVLGSATKGAGGNIRIFGGSWIMSADDQTVQVDRFLVKYPTGGTVNFTTAPIVFDGFAIEIRGNFSKLYQCKDVVSTMVLFNQCRIFNNSSQIKNIVEMTRQNYIKFRDCNFVRISINANHETFTIDSSAYSGSVGELVFEGTTWPEPITAGVVQKMLSDVIIFSNGFGIARGRNNFGRTTAVFTSEPFVIAQDFDLSAVTSTDGVMSATSPHRPLKTTTMMNAATFPNAGGTARERTVKLPVGAMIKSIYIEKDLSGANTDAYQLHVGTSDKVTIYGSSTLAQIKDLHTIEIEKQFIDVGVADNERIVRMWATGDTNTDIVSGGHAFIEYY